MNEAGPASMRVAERCCFGIRENGLAQHKILAEINPSDLFVIGEFLGCSGLENVAFEKEVGAVGDAEGFVNVMVGDKNADVLFLEFGHDLLNVFDRNGVNACKGFIEEYEVGIHRQTACNFSPSSFASRK